MSELFLELRQRMRILQIPGLSLRIAQNGKTLFSKDLGVTDLLTGKQLNGEHVFRIGCLTKPFVAHAVLQLVEQGFLDFEIPINCFIPELKTCSEFGFITIAHLLCHTSGLARGPYCSLPSPDEDNLARIGSSQLTFRAGESFKYSNWGYFLLGQVIKRITGKREDKFIAEAILYPHGLHRTGFSSNKKLESDLTTGYWKGWYFGAADLSSSSKVCPRVPLPDSAAGMISSTDDCLRWLIALTGGSETIMPMTSAVATGMLTDRHIISDRYSSCFGLYAEDICGDRIYFFSGDSSGYSGFIFAVPEQGLTGVALCNHSSCTIELKDILFRVACEVIDEAHIPNFGRGAEEFDVAAYNRAGGTVRLKSTNGNNPNLTWDGQQIRLYPQNETVFFLLNGSERRHVLRVSGHRKKDTAITIGDQVYYSNTCRESAVPTVSESWLALCGFYHCNSFGMVEVFLRDGQLYLSYGAMYETLLHPTCKNHFRQRSGPFRYETICFERCSVMGEVASFSMNGMVFVRQLQCTLKISEVAMTSSEMRKHEPGSSDTAVDSTKSDPLT